MMMILKAVKHCLIVIALSFALAAEAQNYQIQPVVIQSRWAKDVSPANALKEYPRPQLVRANWINLNGLWEYAITAKNAAKPAGFDGQIFPPLQVFP